MKLTMLAAVGLLLAVNVGAQEVRRVPADVLARIVDDEPTLPRGFTPEERANWRLPDLTHQPLAPPATLVHTSAEYEKNAGLLIRWGSQNAILTDMTVAITTGEPDVQVNIVVSSGLLSSATSTLTNAGANMAQVRFIVGNSDTVWMRDYGPRYVEEQGKRSIIDHVYNRPRPQDDAVPTLIAQTLGEAKYDIPLTHGGGNFHLFDDNTAYMTRLIANENPGLSEQQIRDYYMAYQGLDVTIVDPMPTSFDSTQHIDMWMLPADDGRVIINEYPNTGGVYTVPRQTTEATATLLAQRGKTVLRIGGWSSGGTHYTYANAVVLNRTVLTCQFTGYTAENANALNVFQQAFPNRQIVPINCSSIIGLAGAIHCIVMHMPSILPRNGFE
jgi:agmatine/peptidylarginine deiminase